MDKGLRGRWRNTPSHLSLILEGYFRNCTLKVNILHVSVMFRREVFGEVIGKVFSSLLTVEAKSFLLDAIPHPVEAHVKCFGDFQVHVAGEDSMRGFAVSFYFSGRLMMTHLNQGRADGNSLLDVEEYRTGFSIGGGCHDGADGLALGGDWAVCSGSRPYGGRGCIVVQILISCSTTVCFSINKIRCVTVNVETHVDSLKTGDCVWLCGSVVHHNLRLFGGVSGGRSLLRDDFFQRGKHGGIDGT